MVSFDSKQCCSLYAGCSCLQKFHQHPSTHFLQGQGMQDCMLQLFAQVIEDAGRDFQGGPEQALVTIAKSQLALARGEVDAALTLLRHV